MNGPFLRGAMSTALGPLLLALGLAACGGGGGDSGGDGGTPNPPPSPPPSAAASSPVLSAKLSLRAAADLGAFTPWNLNDLNEVAGSVTTQDGRQRAAIWSSSGVQRVDDSICDLPSGIDLNCQSSVAQLNGTGSAVVHWSTRSDHGFRVMRNGQYQGGFAESESVALTSDGRVLAWLGPSSIGTLLSFEGGNSTSLAELTDEFASVILTAEDVNGQGEILATRTGSGQRTSAFIHNVTSGQDRFLLGANLSQGTLGRAINEVGQVAGSVQDENAPEQAALWSSDGSLQTLACPESAGVALALTDAGVVAGACGADASTQRAALWQGTTHVDVNTLLDPPSVAAGWVVRRVSRINANGWMIAEAAQGGADAVSVLLRPASP